MKLVGTHNDLMFKDLNRFEKDEVLDLASEFFQWVLSFFEVVEEGVGEVNIVQHALALVEGNVKAVKKILSIGVAELSGVLEASAVSSGIGVVLHGLNDVAEALCSQRLLGNNSMDVGDRLGNVGEISLVNVAGIHWVPHNSLIVGNGPGGGRHHSELVVALWDDRSEEGVLGAECSESAQLEKGSGYWSLC